MICINRVPIIEKTRLYYLSIALVSLFSLLLCALGPALCYANGIRITWVVSSLLTV